MNLDFLKTVAMILVIVGGLNWGLVGIFGLDLVAHVFGGGSMIAKVVYTAVGVAALYVGYLTIAKK